MADAPHTDSYRIDSNVYTVIADNRQSNADRIPGDFFIEFTAMPSGVTDIPASDLGGGTATLVGSYVADASDATAADWFTIKNEDGDSISITLGRTYSLTTRIPWLAVLTAGMTAGDFTLKVRKGR